MMCSDRRRDIEAGVLLYLKELAVQLVPNDHANKRGQYTFSLSLLSCFPTSHGVCRKQNCT